MNITKNFGIGFHKHNSQKLYLLPAIRLDLFGGEHFTKCSWMVNLMFLHYTFSIGYLKLTKE